MDQKKKRDRENNNDGATSTEHNFSKMDGQNCVCGGMVGLLLV